MVWYRSLSLSILSRAYSQTHIYLSRNQYQTICHDIRKFEIHTKWRKQNLILPSTSCLCSRTRPFSSKYDVDLRSKDGRPIVPDATTLFKILAALYAIKWIFQAKFQSGVINGYPEVTWSDFYENMLQKEEIQEISLFEPDTAVITLKPGASFNEVISVSLPNQIHKNIWLMAKQYLFFEIIHC